MKITDQKTIVKNYFKRLSAKKEKRLFDKIHNEVRMKDFLEKDKVFNARKSAMIEHENENSLKKAARTKEVDKRRVFLNLSSSLNIIS